MDLIVGVHPVHLLAGLRKPRGKKERLDHVAQRVTAFLLLAQPRAHPTEGNSCAFFPLLADWNARRSWSGCPTPGPTDASARPDPTPDPTTPRTPSRER